MLFLFNCLFITFGVSSFEMPACNQSEYLEPSLMSCQACPTNVSMVASTDGFSCSCGEHSVPVGIAQCRPCNTTEVVSADRTTCVPRKCQNNSGRIVCRKCPNDYISVTQNLDGSPTKEVLCIKCARGFKPQNNACVRCESCACARNEVVVGGACVPKQYLAERPKHDGSRLHPTTLLDIVKHEYRCTKGDVLACRLLAGDCVRNFYMTDLGGPCRLWVQKIASPKGLPKLLIEPTSNDFKPGEFTMPRGKDSLLLVLAVYSFNGGFKVIESPDERLFQCSLPKHIQIGNYFVQDCDMNITKWTQLDQNSTFAPYLNMDGVLKPLPVVVRTPSDHFIQRGSWSSTNFRRYFLVNNFISTSTNVTGTVYLRELSVRLRIERDKYQSGSLRLQVSIEVRYATKSPHSQSVTTTLSVQHDMPSAGIFRGLEIWGGVLGTLLSLYAIVQWRGEMRRGGLHFSFVPLMAGSVSDALYFAAWFSTLHALAAEAGTLGMTLPLSRAEERVIRAFVYSAVSLKAVKVAWLNWKQCRCDIFFLDWSEYNTPPKENSGVTNNNGSWRVATVAREWSRLQTQRRAPPSYTVTLALLILQIMTPWQGYLPQSKGYRWAVASIAWISSYGMLLGVRWVMARVAGDPSAILLRVCKETDLSLLVFQEEYYAHYVHGRNDDSKDLRLLAGPLAMCRVVMAPQLRIVYKQLTSAELDDLGSSDARRVVLTRLLAAFFERALDGLNWVASERTVPERLLDVELTEREAGTTSVLLYDPDDSSPSCMAVTWWGEEWSIGTFDTMLFGCVVLTTDDPLLAAFVTIVTWQILKQNRLWFGNRNQRYKTNFDATMLK